jgi:hypothetical protein
MVTILSLVFPFDEHSILAKKTKNVYAAESMIPNKTAKLWDGTFDIVEKEKADECRNDYLDDDSSSNSLYRLIPISIHYNTVTLDEGASDQGKMTTDCDDDSTADYEDVLKKRKKKRR